MSSHVVTPKWNIIFLIYADLSENTTPNEDTSIDSVPIKFQVDAIRDELLKAPLSPHYNIAIITNLKDLADSDLQGSSYFYTLERAEGAAENMLTQKHEFKKEGLLLQKKPALKYAFEKVEESFEATNTVLITWDHGSGYGLLKQVTAGDNILDMLTNDELGEAIRTGIKRQKVDVVIMFNCFMHNLHTLYALRGATDYFVGPESIIAHPGYDYTAILNNIHLKEDITGEEIASIAVCTLKDKFIRHNRGWKAEELAIFGSKMSEISQLFSLIEHLSDALIDIIHSNPSIAITIIRDRPSCYEMTYPSYYDMIDLVNWLCRLIEKCSKPPLLVELHEKIKEQINKIRMVSAIGNHPYSDNYQADKRFPPSGYSLYVPETEYHYSEIEPVFNNYIAPGALYQCSFIDGVKWRALLDLIFVRAFLLQAQ